MSKQQIIIPERFLNYIYNAFKDSDHNKVKIFLRDGRKLRNIEVWNGCVLLVDKGINLNSNDIEILQMDYDFKEVPVHKH